MTAPESSPAFNLPSLSLSLRTLFTGFLAVIGLGLLMSGAQILLTHGMADGEFGVSRNDIVFSYYGNRNGSRMAEKLAGTMKDKASVADRAKLIEWIKAGSPRERWAPDVQPIVSSNCAKCHGTIPGLADFRTYKAVTAFTKVNDGASISALTRVSHIHLFGIAFISFFVCVIFSLSVGLPKWLKATVIALPFIFQFIDILSWWMTKWYPGFAYMTIVGGFSYHASSAFMILTSLYQMWVMPWRGRTSDEHAWIRLP